MPSPKNDIQAISEMYDRVADQYERAQQGRFVRWIIRDGRVRAARPLRGHVLDVGIGSGAGLMHYPGGTQVTGIDLSPRMIGHAERRLRQLAIPGRLHTMDAQQLDFPDASFDSVVFSLVLCTIPDPLRALREALRVAKPGAPMVFLEHVRSNRRWVALAQDVINALSVRKTRDRTNQETEKLIRAAGIEVLEVDRWLLGAMSLIVGRKPHP